jgi:hypothetical protein
VTPLPPTNEENSSASSSPTSVGKNLACNGEEVGILTQLRPVIRRFVSTVKDYTKYIQLSKTYAGKLDPNFICGITKILSAIEKDIRELIGFRWPRATDFLDENFHPLMVDLEDKAKAAVYGNFSKEFPNLFKKLLESCYTFIKVIRSHFESNTIHSRHGGDLISPGTNNQKDYDNCEVKPKKSTIKENKNNSTARYDKAIQQKSASICR